MKTPKRKRRIKQISPEGSTRAKDDIVEKIIAIMHQTPGVAVQRNVFLPAIDGSGRTREIDVLLTGQIAGYPVQVAIECKNEKEPTGTPEIDGFIGELLDVGIPIQQGIFITASRYTKGAILRAKNAGIRPLVLREATDSSLKESIRGAFQSLIYLLLSIIEINIHNDVDTRQEQIQMLLFRTQDGEISGSVPDLIWQEWLSGNISDELGIHNVDIEIPKNWIQVINGKEAKVSAVKVRVQITGQIITIPGLVRHLSLLNASNQQIERWRIEANFDKLSGTYPVTSLSTEAELQNFINEVRGINLSIGRFLLPRIVLGPMYWPPSNETANKVIRLMKAFHEGKIPDPRPLNLAEIEGTDLQKIWEPIWDEYQNHPFFKMS